MRVSRSSGTGEVITHDWNASKNSIGLLAHVPLSRWRLSESDGCEGASRCKGALPGDELLMRFYQLLGQAIEVTRVASLPHWEYLSAAKLWNVECNRAVSNPTCHPPLLAKVTMG